MSAAIVSADSLAASTRLGTGRAFRRNGWAFSLVAALAVLLLATKLQRPAYGSFELAAESGDRYRRVNDYHKFILEKDKSTEHWKFLSGM